MNLAQLTDDVLSRLGENQSTAVAQYRTGGTQVPVITTAQTVAGYLNDAQNDFARKYYPIQDTITYEWPAGVQFAKYTSFACGANSLNVAHGVRTLNYPGASTFRYASRAAVENWDQADLADSNGNPKYWYDDGIEGIGLSVPAPSAAAVTGRVLVIPAPLVEPEDVPQITADLHRILSFYAAAMVCQRKKEDPILMARGDSFLNLYITESGDVLDLIRRRDADLVYDLLKSMPAAPVQQGAQGS